MNNFRITFYDAGRQDAILIESDGYVGFVDGGTYSMNKKLIPWLKAMGITKLDFYIGTHGHANHIGCAGALINTFKPSIMYIPHKKVKTAMLNKCTHSSERNILTKTAVQILNYGSPVINYGNLSIKCLGPKSIISCGTGVTSENSNSLILKLEYGDKKVLLCGDTNQLRLASALERDSIANTKYDVYKNAHHNGATKKAILKTMLPTYTVICHSSKPSILYQRTLKSVDTKMITVCAKSYGTTSFTYVESGKPFLMLNHGQRIVETIPTFVRVLKYGFSGEDVKFLQKRLIKFGFDFIKEDGIFNEDVADAVGMFRYLYGKTVIAKVSDTQWSKNFANTMVDQDLWNLLWKEPQDLAASKKSGYIIDISAYDPVMPGRVKYVVDLVIIRSSIGFKKDTLCEKHIQMCKDNGIPFAVYDYIKSTTPASAAKEAEFLFNAIGKHNPLFYFADVEYSGIDNSKAREIISAWTKMLKDLGVKHIGYYVANHRRKAMNLEESEAEVIWVPNYGKNTGSWDGAEPYAKCDIHQYSSKGFINCVPRRKDVNRIPPYGRRTVSFLQGKER